MKVFGDTLTASVNRKGVLDIDVVKGCSQGISRHGAKGCYDACYAASIAKLYGYDFSVSVVRKVKTHTHARNIMNQARAAPFGFFRVGTMGDPSHSWEETVNVVCWLAPHATPIIVTKHWQSASDLQLGRLVEVGAIINTSISALDSSRMLLHRENEIKRYVTLGGMSVARVVSCDFNMNNATGARLAAIQDGLFNHTPMIDNPLRITNKHPLVVRGIVSVRKVRDITSMKSISIPTDSETYLGHCSACPDLCGVNLFGSIGARPAAPQCELFNNYEVTNEQPIAV